MITIIHGDDLSSSRNYLKSFRREGEMQLYDGEIITITDLAQHFDGGGLFEQPKHIILENFFSKRKKSTELDSILQYIQTKTLEHEIVFWEPKELDKKTLSQFPHATVKTFKIPQTIFSLLDNIKPGNGKVLVKLLQQTLESSDIEFVFFMIIRQVRLLIACKENSTETIDEIKRIQPWQQGKLEKQARLFSNEELIVLHKKLYEIDRDMKTGELNAPLNIVIDILLITI